MGEEYKFVLLLVPAVILLLVHVFVQKVNNHSVETFDAVGTIEMINQDDCGYHWYYVSVTVGERVFSAKTDSYKVSPKGTRIGDNVHVKYHYITQDKMACYIDDVGFERVIEPNTNGKPFALYMSIGFFALFVILLLKQIVF